LIFGDQVRGVGFLHNGGVSTIFQFLNAPRFSFGDDPNVNRRNVEQFILSLYTRLAPIVGQQLTLGAAPDSATADRLDLLLARADLGECDVVVKGMVAGEARGALYAGAGAFVTDRATDGTLSAAALIAVAATPGQEQTFTVVPPGNGRRAAIDRDLDGALFRYELDSGSSPSDATSFPGGPTFTSIQTTSLALKDQTSPANPSRRKLGFTSKTGSDPAGHRIVPPPRGPGDPTIHGATLVVYDSDGTGEAVTIELNAAKWSASGSATSPTYRYQNTDRAKPISKVSVRADRVAVTGGRAGFGYTLDEPRQGGIAIRLARGTAAVLCADAPARATGRPPTTRKYDTVDRFKAAPKTPAPVVCPQLPIQG
jgi:hypothetical protein